jgi:DNA-binding NarL/FixJ family response regulator
MVRPTRIRLVVADDHTLVRQGVVSLLAADPALEIVGEAHDGASAIEVVRSTLPDVLVIDWSMPAMNGLEVVRRLHAERPGLAVLVLTMHAEEEYVLHAVRAGARGFLLKDSAGEELRAAVHALAAGGDWYGPHASGVLARQVKSPGVALDDPYRNLTDREREVFHLLVEASTTKQIARRLDISVKTAENHRARVLEKLECRNAAEVIRYAVRRGLLS